MSLWKQRPLTIPPNSGEAWLRLVVWEMWMGTLLCLVFGFGIGLMVTSPDHILTVTDFSRCDAAPQLDVPCERILYRIGQMNAVFTSLFGLALVCVGAWVLWELWRAVEPRPINDDFLKLLDDSFGRDWRNPFTWPWARVFWAYGFTAVGAIVATTAGFMLWTLLGASSAGKPPPGRVDTQYIIRLAR